MSIKDKKSVFLIKYLDMFPVFGDDFVAQLPMVRIRQCVLKLVPVSGQEPLEWMSGD